MSTRGGRLTRGSWSRKMRRPGTNLAENLLRDNRYTASEVAFLTGFSEQSAFNRAFKRWTGQTPTTFRKAARPSPHRARSSDDIGKRSQRSRKSQD